MAKIALDSKKIIVCSNFVVVVLWNQFHDIVTFFLKNMLLFNFSYVALIHNYNFTLFFFDGFFPTQPSTMFVLICFSTDAFTSSKNDTSFAKEGWEPCAVDIDNFLWYDSCTLVVSSMSCCNRSYAFHSRMSYCGLP